MSDIRRVNMITWDLVKQLDWVEPFEKNRKGMTLTVNEVYHSSEMDGVLSPGQNTILKKVIIR